VPFKHCRYSRQHGDRYDYTARWVEPVRDFGSSRNANDERCARGTTISCSALCLLDSGDLCTVDFDGLAQHIYGHRDHYEIDVAMRAKNGGASFGIAAFLLSFAKSNLPSSSSEAAIHTDCSIREKGLQAAIRCVTYECRL